MYIKKAISYVPVAQLDRVSASDAEGRGFESPRVRHLKKKPLFMSGFFMASRVVEPTGSFWLVSVFQTQTRCGHLICNAFSAAFCLASKLTNLRLSSENSSPENFLSSSPQIRHL